MSIKIAFIGKMCSGKSFICQYLQSLQPEFEILSFASKIKDIAIELYGMEYKDRELLQKIGSKMREIDEDVFSKYLIKESKKYNFVLVDDVRYPNELFYLKKNGFILVKLVISSQLQKERLHQLYGNKAEQHIALLEHSSEILQDNMDDNLFDKIINVDNENVKKAVSELLFQNKV
jgi:hypothetical protein